MAIDTLGANALASNSVTTAKISDEAVTSAKVAAGAVAVADIADGSITTAKLADNAVTTAKIVDSAVTQPKTVAGKARNSVINGAMQIAQKNTSVTGLGGGSISADVCDLWYLTPSATAGRLTKSQVTDSPAGFSNSLKLDCTTADTSIAAGELLILSHKIEGLNLQQFEKGVSTAKTFAVSFYVKGNASATYVCELYDHDNTRQVSQTFSVTTSWSRVSIVFPADTTGAFDKDNNLSLSLQIWLHAGSTYGGGTLSTTWTSVTQANRAVGITSFFDSTARTFQITGVQLEPVSVTDFEHRLMGDVLLQCQRYLTMFKFVTQYGTIGSGKANNTTDCNIHIDLPIQMRVKPTITHTDISTMRVDAGTSGNGVRSYNTVNNYLNEYGGLYNLQGASNLGGEGTGVVIRNESTGQQIRFSAEL